MAVVTITRQVAALGDEIATALAKQLGYVFIDRHQIEARITELGFPEKKLPKYDERKPGFFASMAKDRDEYLYYLQYAILEAARNSNCILIGRGAFAILDELPNVVKIKFIAPDDVRIERLKNDHNWTEKQALSRMNESSLNRRGFLKSFFNIDHEDPANYFLTLNTGLVSVDEAVKLCELLVKTHVTPEAEEAGKKRMENLFKAQILVNKLVFDYKTSINFLHADVNEDGSVFTLQGVADSQTVAENAVEIAAKIYPSAVVKSGFTIVQDFKNFNPH